jgi:hypothetical protein
VAGTLQRRFWVLLGAATTAMVCWIWLPGTAIDRLAFTAVARSFANPPFFISGNGSHAAPWNLRTFAAGNPADARQAPVIVALGDDREGFFQSSPPSPIDLAVILTNFQRLGARQAATAVVMAWDSPDPIGLAALDKAIGRFDSLVMAVPLSRGAVSEAMPPAFRKASVPLASVAGDSSSLPVVNRIPLPGVILGQENTAAGFQTLNAETDGKSAPLLACWEDRVVFSFALLCVLQRLELPVADVEIHPGAWLKLGPHGPILPIDRYGRLAMPRKPVAPCAEIPAESLIDGGDGLIPREAPPPVVLRDDRSAAEPATRAFSKQLPTLIAALASSNTMAPAHDYPRPQADRELVALLLVALVLAIPCVLRAFPRHIVYLSMAGLGIAAQCLAAGTANLWLPGLPALAAIGCAVGLSTLIAITPEPFQPVPAPIPNRPPRQIPKPPPLTAAIAAPGPKTDGKPMTRRKTTPKNTPPEPKPEPVPVLEPEPAPEPKPEPVSEPAPAPEPEPAPVLEPVPEPEPEPEPAPKPAPILKPKPKRKAAPTTAVAAPEIAPAPAPNLKPQAKRKAAPTTAVPPAPEPTPPTAAKPARKSTRRANPIATPAPEPTPESTPAPAETPATPTKPSAAQPPARKSRPPANKRR